MGPGTEHMLSSKQRLVTTLSYGHMEIRRLTVGSEEVAPHRAG